MLQTVQHPSNIHYLHLVHRGTNYNTCARPGDPHEVSTLRSALQSIKLQPHFPWFVFTQSLGPSHHQDLFAFEPNQTFHSLPPPSIFLITTIANAACHTMPAHEQEGNPPCEERRTHAALLDQVGAGGHRREERSRIIFGARAPFRTPPRTKYIAVVQGLEEYGILYDI